MERRKSKRSTVALLCACVWALVVLCLSLPVRPAETAHAVEGPNTVITVKAYNSGATTGSGYTGNYVWGYFYRGMELLTESRYRVVDEDGNVVVNGKGDKKEGTINWESDTESYKDFTYDFGELEYDSVLNEGAEDGHTHYFTEDDGDAGGKSWTAIDANSHWAACDCGFQLEVAHRPDGMGDCADCTGKDAEDKDVVNGALGSYVNTFSFTIPGPGDNGYGEWYEDGGYENFEIEIEVSATVILGYTLTLKLVCGGGLSLEDYTPAADEDPNDFSIDYMIVVSYRDNEEEITDFSSEGVPIWSYSPTEEESSGGIMATISKEKITVRLQLQIDEDPPAYPGSYTDTLTFSAELILTGEGTS